MGMEVLIDMKKLLAAILVFSAGNAWALTRIQRKPAPDESASQGAVQPAPNPAPITLAEAPVAPAPAGIERNVPAKPAVRIERQRANPPAPAKAIQSQPAGNSGRTRITRRPADAPPSTY